MVKQFSGICLISRDVPHLCSFYETILQMAAREKDENIADFTLNGAAFSIFSWSGMEGMVPGSMTGAGMGCMSLDFEVEDADREYERICALNIPIVKPPVTYPWGRRSFWFRDLDGNIVNFFMDVAS